MRPTNNDITRALESIEASERDDEHPRAIAKREVSEWRSNAETEKLPVVNVRDDKDAPSLRVDDVLRKSYPDCVGLK